MWGGNAEHEISFGGFTEISTPMQESGYSSWLDVSAGDGFTIAIRSDSSLWAWGTNDYGQFMDLAPPSSDVPYRISQEKWKAIYTRDHLCLGIKSDGTLWGWGSRVSKLLPTGTTGIQITPVQIGVATWLSLSIGENFVVALATDSTVWAWGDNSQKQVSEFTVSYYSNPVAVNIPGKVKKVLASNGFAGALNTDTELWMWGRNNEYQLAELFSGSEPILVDNGWNDFALGSTFSTGVDKFGNAYWWGFWRGEDAFFPLSIEDAQAATNIVQVHASQTNVFLVNADGRVFATGLNGSGQLGIQNELNQTNFVQMKPNPPVWYPEMDLCLTLPEGGDTIYDIRNALRMPVGSSITEIRLEKTPSRVIVSEFGTTLHIKSIPGVSGYDTLFVAVKDHINPLVHASIPVWVRGSSQKGLQAIGFDAGFYFSAAIFPDSTLWFWGANFNGRFGNGTYDSSFIPVQGNAYKWRQISLGSFQSLGLRADSTLWSWGLGGPGLLAINTTADVMSPTKTSDAKWMDVQCDYMTCVGLQADSTLWRWGVGTDNVYIPLKMNEEKWIHIGSGEFTIIAIRADSTLWSWGQNARGELGVGDIESRYTDMAQVGSDKWIDIDMGSGWAMGIQSDSTLWAWGLRAWCGDATAINNSRVPLQITSGKWITVDVNGNIGAALLNDGTLWTLGSNNNGALGDGRSTCRESLAKISDQTWKRVALSSGHMLATDENDNLYSWGENYQGQLGNGNTYWHSGPQLVPGINPSPLTIAKVNMIYQMVEDGPAIYIPLQELIEDPNAESLTWNALVKSNILQATIDGDELKIEISIANWDGEESVVVYATDQSGGGAVYEVKCVVNEVNDVPQISSWSNITQEEDSGIVVNDYISIFDVEADSTYFEVEMEYPVVGQVKNTVYLEKNYFGTFNLSIIPKDIRGGSGDTVKIPVNMTPVNDPPFLVSKKPRFIYEDSSLQLSALQLDVEDPESDPSFGYFKSGSHYTLKQNAIVPEPNWSGVLWVNLFTTDNKDTLFGQYLQIGVMPRNDAPIIDSVWNRVVNANKSIEVTDDFVFYHDLENDSCSIIVGDGETYSVEGATITPNRGFSGVITVPIWVTDFKDTSRVEFLKLTVNKPLGLLDREGVLTPEVKPGRAFDLLGRRSFGGSENGVGE